MPAFDPSPAARAIHGSVYSRLADRAAAAPELYPFHVGDTWREPPVTVGEFDSREFPGMHRYTPVPGLPALRRALADRIAARGAPTAVDEVLVTAGATAGITALLAALVHPGDEVVLCAPYWPLVGGATRMQGGTPIPVSVLDVESAADFAARLDAACTPRTRMIYVNSPNNPSGRVLPRSWLEALVEVARRRDVWILSDEVYEDYSWGEAHTWVRTLAPERTISAWSASKAFGMAGLRVGWLAGPRAVLEAVERVCTYTFYCAPRPAQEVVLRAVHGAADAWVDEARAAYRAIGNEAADALGVARPQGGTFLFVDTAPYRRGRTLDALLTAAADVGVLVAPGTSFGPFPDHIRLCYTAAPPDVTRRGVAALARVLRGG